MYQDWITSVPSLGSGVLVKGRKRGRFIMYLDLFMFLGYIPATGPSSKCVSLCYFLFQLLLAVFNTLRLGIPISNGFSSFWLWICSLLMNLGLCKVQGPLLCSLLGHIYQWHILQLLLLFLSFRINQNFQLAGGAQKFKINCLQPC